MVEACRAKHSFGLLIRPITSFVSLAERAWRLAEYLLLGIADVDPADTVEA